MDEGYGMVGRGIDLIKILDDFNFTAFILHIFHVPDQGSVGPFHDCGDVRVL